MAEFEVIPIRVSALVLKKDTAAVEGKARFSTLPFFDGQRDVNSTTPYLSESVLSRPFASRNLCLKAGVHLHWLLPDSLRRGIQRADGLNMPAVPDRWLVRRRGDSPERKWLVESNYCYPVGSTVETGVSILNKADSNPEELESEINQPYRAIGRQIPFDAWDDSASSSGADYIDLTALGYGEPAFSAFYPNCLSVFGLHDRDLPQGRSTITYDIIGWYSDPATDLASSPRRRLFQTRLTIRGSDTATQSPPDLSVAVGNTAAEALSAILGSALAQDVGKRRQIEEQLDLAQLLPDLGQRQQDFPQKFREARHRREFTAQASGSVWSLRQEEDPQKPRNESQNDTPPPPELAHELHELNAVQKALDRTAHEADSMRWRLFSDWYKYMICAYPPEGAQEDYPPVDEVRHFLKTQLVPAVNWFNSVLMDLQQRQQEARNGVTTSLASLNKGRTAAGKPLWQLNQNAASRFWRPNEPVVLMTWNTPSGSGSRKSTDRTTADGTTTPAEAEQAPARLSVSRIADSSARLTRDELGSILKAIDSDFQKSVPTLNSTDSQTEWKPVVLEWEVELLPIQQRVDSAAGESVYDPDLVLNNYALEESDSDFSREGDIPPLNRGASIYSGLSILSGHAGQLLVDSIDSLADSLPAGNELATVLEPAKQKLEGLSVISQSLDGFNDALLQHKQTLQLSIADPIGFDEDRRFSAGVIREAVRDANRTAPLPLNDFNPLRAGALKFRSMRLVDSFGRTHNLKPDEIITTQRASLRKMGRLLALPPRLAQPARINFRWLSGVDDDEEMSEHPVTSPVCGWVLPNFLDNSLVVYSREGQPLGTLDRNANWKLIPGQSAPADIESISNRHLRRMIRLLSCPEGMSRTAAARKQRSGFVGGLLKVAAAALPGIEPENFRQFKSRALLAGRPLALVRATLNLELMGLPEINHGWLQFRQDLQGGLRSSDGFTDVLFPIRIGDCEQLNDGLIGFWNDREVPDAKPQNASAQPPELPVFTAPHEVAVASKAIQTEQRELSHGGKHSVHSVIHSINSPPECFLMLVDPRGTVSVTSGVLPAKELSIPPFQFSDAMDAIDLTFQCAPVLGERQPDSVELASRPLGDQSDEAGKQHSIQLPVPEEPGYEWSWLERSEGSQATWSETAEIGAINTRAEFSGPQSIRDGWLKLNKTPAAEADDSNAQESTQQ